MERERAEVHEVPGMQPGPVTVLVVGALERVHLIVDALRAHACEVEVLENVKRVADECEQHWPEVVVLDIANTRRAEALDALDWLRRAAMLPTIVVTQPDDVDARLRALSLRADDAVAPADPREIVARIALLVRRSRTRQSNVRPLGDLVIERAGRRVTRRGRDAALTQRELEVLEVLVERPGRVVSKEELLDRVWNERRRSTNAVEAQISGLRRKLHELGPPIIHTAHGEGYVFRPAVVVDLSRRSHMISERERLVREREEAVAMRARLLRQMEQQMTRRREAQQQD
jgi:DNA-binding response OmpR family regulator